MVRETLNDLFQKHITHREQRFHETEHDSCTAQVGDGSQLKLKCLVLPQEWTLRETV